jgi:hypothetical protein
LGLFVFSVLENSPPPPPGYWDAFFVILHVLYSRHSSLARQLTATKINKHGSHT